MDWHQIKGRVAAGEDVRTEFKRSLEFRQVGKTICGFANTAGGVLILGVDDAGDVVGIRGDVESVRERLTSFLQNGCNVPVRATCGHRATASGHVHWIEVPRQRGFEPMRHDGRVWVRRERSTVEPSPTELQSLYNAFGYVLTEEQTILAAGPNDIDMDAFRGHLTRQGFDVTREPQPAVEDDLRNRGVLAEFDGRLHPTLYGLMSFGKHPQGYPHTGNFWVDCVAYAGNDQAAEIILAGEAKGRVDEQVERALGWARSLGRFEKYEGLEREDIPLLPPTALREALVNAVVHRDYAISGSKVLLEVFHDRVGRHEARLRVNRARRLPKRPKPPTRGAACSLARRRELMDAWAAQSLVSPSLPLRSSAAIRGLYHLYTSYVNCILPRLGGRRSQWMRGRPTPIRGTAV